VPPRIVGGTQIHAMSSSSGRRAVVSSTSGMSSSRRRPLTHTVAAPATNSRRPCVGHHITPPLHTLEGDGEGDHPCTWRRGREKERRDRVGVVPGGVEAKSVSLGSRRSIGTLLVGGGGDPHRRRIGGDLFIGGQGRSTPSTATPRFIYPAAIFRQERCRHLHHGQKREF
jgi:hypothetical protein